MGLLPSARHTGASRARTAPTVKPRRPPRSPKPRRRLRKKRLRNPSRTMATSLFPANSDGDHLKIGGEHHSVYGLGSRGSNPAGVRTGREGICTPSELPLTFPRPSHIMLPQQEPSLAEELLEDL